MKEFEEYAKNLGVQIKQLPNGHYQLKGKLLVNYWPESKHRTVYYAGTKFGYKDISPKEAICMANRPPYKQQEQVKRRKPQFYRRIKIKLLRARSNCHWCNQPLVYKTATIEHLIPLKRSGLDEENNIKLVCRECNLKRGAEMPELKD